MVEIPKQIVVLNTINQVFNFRLPLILRGFKVLEFFHLEDVVNWLATCSANTINVAAIILKIKEADPLLASLSEFQVPIYVVNTDDALERQLKRDMNAASSEYFVFCRDENQLEVIFQEFG
ncbi:hypothetical protein [uncultured Desulfuromonas sp.]|uniref:hypothetical protein n=1 Tax=uncultured Desulfuromonas sp. TaxID=181013 RepID=UPI002AAB8CA8|nr:hypothetical protein [uncultured Desulfuromonas sp.]